MITGNKIKLAVFILDLFITFLSNQYFGRVYNRPFEMCSMKFYNLKAIKNKYINNWYFYLKTCYRSTWWLYNPLVKKNNHIPTYVLFYFMFCWIGCVGTLSNHSHHRLLPSKYEVHLKDITRRIWCWEEYPWPSVEIQCT